MLSPESYPSRYWHCLVETDNADSLSVANDLSFDALQKQVIAPWREGRPFTVEGRIIRSSKDVHVVRVIRSKHPTAHYIREVAENIRRSGEQGTIILPGDSRLYPFTEGEDYTNELLFDTGEVSSALGEIAIIETVCRRIRNTARILEHRSRGTKVPFKIEDEYDVHDLLHAVIRAYIRYSVQEQPLPKVAAVSSRADIAIEQLGVLIEVKYVRNPSDQRRILEEFSQDLPLYAAWTPLKIILFVIFNSDKLRDPEAFETLGGRKEMNGKRFEVRIILT
jgi:hypothetical protein